MTTTEEQQNCPLFLAVTFPPAPRKSEDFRGKAGLRGANSLY
jgi:hypothetical protein